MVWVAAAVAEVRRLRNDEAQPLSTSWNAREQIGEMREGVSDVVAMRCHHW